jgi:hypothetical protein
MNFSIGNIIIAGILIAIGLWFIIKAFWFNHQVFFLGWAEQKWGAGAGTTAYRWIGLTFCILGMFTFLGIVDIYGSAFGGKTPQSKVATKTKVGTDGKPIVRPNIYKGPKNGELAE